MNQILEKIDEINRVFVEATKTNDKRLEEMAKGHDSRATELAQALEKQNAAITALTKQRDDLTREMVMVKERIELAEALIDRPKGTPQERLEEEHKTCFVNALRKGFADQELNQKLKVVE